MEKERVVKSLIATARSSIETKSYYAAFAILLMIPELVCETSDESTYISWCDKNIKNISGFSGEILYKLKKELFFGNNKSNSYSTPNIQIYETKDNKTRFSLETRDEQKNWKTYAADIDEFLDNIICGIERTI